MEDLEPKEKQYIINLLVKQPYVEVALLLTKLGVRIEANPVEENKTTGNANG